MSFLSSYSVLSRFKGVDDVLALDVSSKEPLFGTSFHSFRLINACSTKTRDHRVHSVSPEILFPALDVPLLVVGDLNINNPLWDPLRTFSPREIVSSTSYFEQPAEAGFALLNPPWEYTRFPFVGKARPSVIDLSFANPLLLPMFKGWEVYLPSPDSDHVPITINLAPPTMTPIPRRLRWSDTDWETISPIIKNFQVPAAPRAPHRQTWMRG